MPREVIHDNTHLPGSDNSTPMAVEVAWGRDSGYVSVGSVNLENMDGDKRFTPEYGWFTNLDRTYVNQLIRVLRRARDQAFGADE
jgi:hypothetical protein